VSVSNWSTLPESPVSAPKPRRRGGNAAVTAAATGLGLLALSLFTGSHLIFAVLALPVVIAMAWSNPAAMIALLPVWMVMMGLIRRITPGGGNTTFSGDPVLLVGPVALLVLWAIVASTREPGQMTPLARVVLAFNIVAFVEAFNPSQGSILTGIGGLLFIVVPTAAFWVGRRYAEEDFVLRIIWTIAWLGLLSAIYGLYQQFAHFPSWDERWIQQKAYTALNLGNGVQRAFSFFSSAEEYAVFLSIAAIAWVCLLTRRTRWPMLLHLAALSTVIVALYFESQRTSFFLTMLAVGVVGAARLGFRPINVVIAGIISVILVIVFAGALGGTCGGNSALKGTPSTACVLNNHQASGLSNPTGPGSSLSGHIKETRIGMMDGIKHPFGHGTGSVTLSASRYNAHNKLHGSEFDPGNMGIAFGLPGEIIYFLLLFQALRMAYRLAVRRRDTVGLFVMGIAAATLFQWTNGDLYSVCWLIWLFLGFGDRLLERPTEVAQLEPVPTAPTTSFTWRRPGEGRRTTPNW
jgi:hypothetical protein